jgi:DNA replication initiation complex subunit (GINS family)
MNLKKEYTKLYQHWLKEIDELTLTPLSEELFQNYKNLRDWIEAKSTVELEEIELEIKKIYHENVKYLFSDFLKIREDKILKAASNLKEIDLEIMTDAEKLLFQNLVSTFKGYKKIKVLSTFKDKEELIKESLTPEDKPLEKKVIINTLQNESIPEPTKSSENLIKYVPIRFLKAFEDQLVGNDLLEYGPFEENSIVTLPAENAIILINEKFAEEIDIS